MKISDISNEKLLKMCATWGKTALGARNKFIGLLPEVNRRKLYEKKFVSIFHFAAVMAGVNREQVQIALNLAKTFEKMPHLLELLVNGTVSINKLRKIISLATAENEAELANLVQILSKAALETLVRDVQISKAQDTESAATIRDPEIEDGLFKAQKAPIFCPGTESEYTIKSRNLQHSDSSTNAPATQLFEYVSNPPLNNNVKKKLNELAHKGIDINEIIEAALAQREAELVDEKQKLAEKAVEKMIVQITQEKVASRTAPISTKRLLKKEHGTKCSVPTCNKPSQEIHHSDRFALSQIHDPHFMAPLCREHHQIAHAIDVKATEIRHNKV